MGAESSDRARRAATMKGGRGSNGTATDLLVCFPTRAHLALMPPKAICSPSRLSASEPVKRRHSTSRAGPLPPSALGRSARNPSRRATDVSVDDEPTSPKVTCVGQIKARPSKPKGFGHGDRKHKKAAWLQTLGIKKDVMALLDALHGAFRFNVRGCFGSFPGAVVEYTSGEDNDEDEEEEDERAEKEAKHDAALSRWFMVLEEGKKVSSKKQVPELQQNQEEDKEKEATPPANALMLMRCRSAPAKGLQRRLGREAEEDKDLKNAKKSPEEEGNEKEEGLVLMTYSPDFFKVSLDIAKETWIVGSDDAVLRCRSWKR
ncbi:hypothetical protein PR202_ga02776 [Eleusine coracana subsp. coracana]|uniref:Uncharacterized protein n=1 Tax=Eleusine coracana subsp. coracana TaxID=191504 RepID=A0AAV5BN70_ELECO|nr:hypothetical protein QOZ80_2AG0146120 [Eleusine coracana subsp. coracana]GJM86877.1 hypothetical protein PR202_ga02776 [Eleusine coracana subsp. coracana]